MRTYMWIGAVGLPFAGALLNFSVNYGYRRRGLDRAYAEAMHVFGILAIFSVLFVIGATM